MGPPGLWTELRRHGVAKALHGPEVERLLKGKKVAVDGAVWLYEAQTQADVVRAYGAEGAALSVIFQRCVRWLRKGVLPIIVLEGTGGGRANRTFSRGWSGLGSAFAPQHRVRALLAALGIPCVNAEGEAEATCAALAASGECDFVATTDFDALLFGAPKVLRGLNLVHGLSSKCEVWDAATIERVTGLNRHALVAAAFLIGSDYDCRDMNQVTSRDGQGVRGVGARGAVKLARALSDEGSGNALQALSSQVIDTSSILERNKAANRRRLQRTTSICIPQDRIANDTVGASNLLGKLQHGASMCIPLRKDAVASLDDKEKAAVTRLLERTVSRAAKDPTCREGLAAVVHQYSRVFNGAMSACTGGQAFTWTGVNDAEAQFILSRVYPGRTHEKLEPLHLAWALRVVAAECPAAICRDPAKRQHWALARGLRYVPLSAKKSQRRKSGVDPYVLVEYALTTGQMAPVRLPAERKHARVSLAEACKLLNTRQRQSKDSKKQQSLTDMFVGTAAKSYTSEAKLRGTKKKIRKSILASKASSRQLRLSVFRRRSSRACQNSHTQDGDSKDGEPIDESITHSIMLPCPELAVEDGSATVEEGASQDVACHAAAKHLVAYGSSPRTESVSPVSTLPSNDMKSQYIMDTTAENIRRFFDHCGTLGMPSPEKESPCEPIGFTKATTGATLCRSEKVAKQSVCSLYPVLSMQSASESKIAGVPQFGLVDDYASTSRKWCAQSHPDEAVQSACASADVKIHVTDADRRNLPGTPRKLSNPCHPLGTPLKRRRLVRLVGSRRSFQKAGKRAEGPDCGQVRIIHAARPVTVDLTETDSDDDLPLASLLPAVCAEKHAARS